MAKCPRVLFVLILREEAEEGKRSLPWGYQETRTVEGGMPEPGVAGLRRVYLRGPAP